MAASPLIGKIDPFDEAVESRESYVERFEQYFEVNEIDAGKKVSSLLCLSGGKLCSLLHDLTFPDKSAKKHTQILKTVDQYPLPKTDDILTNMNGGTHFSKIDIKQASHLLRQKKFGSESTRDATASSKGSILPINGDAAILTNFHKFWNIVFVIKDVDKNHLFQNHRAKFNKLGIKGTLDERESSLFKCRTTLFSRERISGVSL